MQINGADQQRGHVLLIAGDVAARRRTVQVVPSANLAALSMVPVPALLGSTVPSDTTYLDGIHDQNALLVRLRAAAATPGPLLVYLSGKLTTDRRGRQLYLALPGTTAATTRYTALPWEWLGTELRTRSGYPTTVLFDLAADKAAWPLLQEHGTLPTAADTSAFGVITPPGFGVSKSGVSTYTQQWIEQLRNAPERLTASRLHALTAATSALPPGTLVIPAAPELTAPSVAEPTARPPMTNVQRLLAGDTSFLPNRRRSVEGELAPGLDRRPAPPTPVQAEAPQQLQPAAAQFPATNHQHTPVPGHHQVDLPVRASHPGPTASQPSVPSQYQGPAQPPAAPPSVPVQQDPRPHIHALSEAGRHGEAAQLAQLWEQHTLQTHGIDSPQATQWLEIRADLAKRAGNYQLATQLWIAAGRTRLAHQSADAAEVVAAATSAHHCWTQMSDAHQARECGPDLISLLRALPTLDRRHLSMAQQRLEYLHTTPSGR
ncbi:hypothetical protein ACIOUE_35680 [Streptomyces xanthochromogenes]|uniref:hypothetical protein n=1 Tax=Streptomyces xanthochromogenes TaxID=67384 RepID=UPI003823F7A4